MIRLLIVLAVLVLAAFALLVSVAHYRIDKLTADLQTEIGKHAVTRAELTACKSASRAACAVAQAVDGKADAEQALQSLIKERKK